MDKNPHREEKLTNEALGKRFSSTFDLVNYAIKLASRMIDAGHGPRVHVVEPELNITNVILEEINEGKDLLTSVAKGQEGYLNGTSTDEEEE